jgi:hypothetical protein
MNTVVIDTSFDQRSCPVLRREVDTHEGQRGRVRGDSPSDVGMAEEAEWQHVMSEKRLGMGRRRAAAGPRNAMT